MKRAARKRSFDTPRIKSGATQDEGVFTSPSSRVGAPAPYRGTAAGRSQSFDTPPAGATQDEGKGRSSSRARPVPRSEVGAGPDISLGILPGLLGYQLRHANLKVVGGFAERIAPHNVTAAQFGLLVLVAANPGATQAALARAFGTDRSAMVRLIDRLEAAGLVDRRAREGDRRSNAIVLTERGAALLETLKREVRAFEDRVTACLTGEETETLLALLRRINAAADGREKRE